MRKESLTTTGSKNDRRKAKNFRAKKKVSERMNNWQGTAKIDQGRSFTALQDALLDPHTNHEGF